MGKHEKLSPGDQTRLDRGQTLAQADAQMAAKMGDPEQLTKDVAQIDNQTYAEFDRTKNDNPYNGRQPS